MLDISGLSVRRGNTVILDRVSWRVESGQHWVILGANGSGKTSLLSALSGYLTPSAGAFSVLGRGYGQADWRELGSIAVALPGSTKAGVAALNRAQNGVTPAPFQADFDYVRVSC